jgi:uncharacterized membrane protein
MARASLILVAPRAPRRPPVTVDAENAPGGEIGHALAALFGQDAGSQIDADLRAFKRAVEAGEFVPRADVPGRRYAS